MPNYLICAADGSILQVGHNDDEAFALVSPYLLNGLPAGSVVIQIAEFPDSTEGLTLRWYVDNSIVRSRVPIAAAVSATSIAADGIAEADITGLPTPSCFCTISGAVTVPRFEITDGTLALTSNVVGSILVSITAPPPWLAWSVTISAS